MYKEILMVVFITVIVFFGDKLTQDYTKKSMTILTDEMYELKQYLEQQNNEKANEKVENIDKNWEKMHDNLAYYIEHNELEKVETNFTACKSFVNSKDYNFAISELEKSIFILNHITDKYAFSWENIF